MTRDGERTEGTERFFVGLAAVTTMIRERDNLSKRELARRAGIGRPLVSNIENCRANPTTRCLVRLAKGLGLSGLRELVALADEWAFREPGGRRGGGGDVDP
jgi:transcriptional regulator with XRE-family HTH domain